jgi:hypothetical protein
MALITARVARARTNKTATLIRAAAEAGVQFVPDGDLLEMRGLENLAQDGMLLLLASLPILRGHLIIPDTRDPEEILDMLKR